MSADEFAPALTDGLEDYPATPEDSAHRSLDRALAKPTPAESPGPDGDGIAAGIVRTLFHDLDAAEADAHNLAHEVDRVRGRLWRLAALAGWRSGNPADNDATAELYITEALKLRVTPPTERDCNGYALGSDWLAAHVAAARAEGARAVLAAADGHGLVRALHDGACDQREVHGDDCAAITRSGRFVYDQAEAVRAYLARAEQETP